MGLRRLKDSQKLWLSISMPSDSDKVTFEVRRVIKAEALNGKTPNEKCAVIEGGNK
jgi:hypothetical protein